MEPAELKNPIVRAVVKAMKEGDREAFLGAFARTAKLTDDGQPQTLMVWADREIFRAHDRLHVEREGSDGLELIGRFRSDTWDMETIWRFDIAGGQVRRLDVAAL